MFRLFLKHSLQLCIQAGLAEKGMIAVTQPRRVAAISLANRVSQEQCTEIGDTVCILVDLIIYLGWLSRSI